MQEHARSLRHLLSTLISLSGWGSFRCLIRCIFLCNVFVELFRTGYFFPDFFSETTQLVDVKPTGCFAFVSCYFVLGEVSSRFYRTSSGQRRRRHIWACPRSWVSRSTVHSQRPSHCPVSCLMKGWMAACCGVSVSYFLLGKVL